MWSFIKLFVERVPAIAEMYRAARNEWVWKRQKAVLTPDGFKLIGRKDMQSGLFESEETALLKLLLERADVFVDVGANIGYYTCLARHLGKYSIAIEPLFENLRYLYANMQENNWTDVEIWPIGVSNQVGMASLYGGGTGASLIGGWGGASEYYKRAIGLSTLEILLGSRFVGKQLIIKMDVEGAEYAALQGASLILDMSPRPLWLVEIGLSEHHPDGFNANYISTFELFWQHGYKARTLGSESRVISSAEIAEWASKGSVPIGTGNYLFEPLLKNA
ncbi:MAG: FkbM family methyltransferase [Ardenticatenaceae bacterium]